MEKELAIVVLAEPMQYACVEQHVRSRIVLTRLLTNAGPEGFALDLDLDEAFLYALSWHFSSSKHGAVKSSDCIQGPCSPSSGSCFDGLDSRR
ncbi:hypothetical protein C8J35_11438 [Rhizobium sp. PP-F2F-G38]|nr:hypothetical protein C8J37_11534 [Rhizobium sp. PP-WC-1G-195]PYE39121.1 hypothetical protein DFI02_13211 [Rhizobium sp. PP-F2F-G20b]PYE93316.1 hypothetical protein C8J35_11438 [Rhizobium sp. PP-F2F-G38]TCL89425.1 hypothetical protein C8J38_11340 [Rhizobium sp. PP-WC-2G-219]TCP75332.1 hypothetical protein C8J31_1339 [Rhizobium sp. PP-CC-2G-626]TCQ02557.1 hypothetical protein C8J34_11728 [Rhizobium sp. PP-F2F-G36]